MEFAWRCAVALVPLLIGCSSAGSRAGPAPGDGAPDAADAGVADAAGSCDPEPSHDELGFCLTGTRSGVLRGGATDMSSGSTDPASHTTSAELALSTPGGLYSVDIMVFDPSDAFYGGAAMTFQFMGDGPVQPAYLQMTAELGVSDACSPPSHDPVCPIDIDSSARTGELDCVLEMGTRLVCQVHVTAWLDESGGNGPGLAPSQGWIHLLIQVPN